MLTKKEITNT